MKLINQSYEILAINEEPLMLIETAGRTCYKSDTLFTKDTSEKFVDMILRRGHESVIEHASATIGFITNRGVTHELVRHRLCSFSQESTRYVNYGGDDIEFIKPVWFVGSTLASREIFLQSCREVEDTYSQLLIEGWRPEQAREVLPNSLKTEIVVTANLREWRHIFKLRTSKAAHPQIRELMVDCLAELKTTVPIIFDDLGN